MKQRHILGGKFILHNLFVPWSDKQESQDFI